MKRIVIAAIGVCVVGVGAAHTVRRASTRQMHKGATYHVNATHGSDSSDGLSPRTAWKSIARVNSADLRPGDAVLFKRGEVWREQLRPRSGSNAGYITYGAYGNGRKPLLLGSVSRSRASDWTHEDGNVWATSGIPVDVGCIIFDHGASVGTKRWSHHDLTRQGDFWYDGTRHAVAMYSQGNPASRYSDIECALTRHIIDESGAGYVIYQDLELRYGAAHGIGGGETHHIVVRNCDLSFIGGGHQFTTADGRPVRYGNGIEFWANAHDNLVEGCRLWEIYDAALTNQGSSDNSQVNIRYRHNVIWNCEYSFEYWNRGRSITDHIYFENNTCVNAGHGWGHRQRPDPSGRHLMFYHNDAQTTHFYVRNNIFYQTPGTTQCCLALTNDWSAGLVADHNCWYQPSGVMIRWLSDTYTMEQFTDYQSRTGQDQHSVVADPLFVNIGARDFRPTASSPVCGLSSRGACAGALSRKG